MAKYTSIGGQALIEGILMKSPEKTAMAVRLPDNEIDITYFDEKSLRSRYKILALPVIRGVVGFAESMVQGYKAMMISADKSGFTDLEDETKKAEASEQEKAEEKKKNNILINIVMVIGTVLGVALSVVLFMLLPRLCVTGLQAIFNTEFSKLVRSGIEQLLKLSVFVLYVWLVSFMKDIKRVFMYHGAEHKTIFCYENDLELTVENVKKQSRFHPRCGTSFLILMLIVGIVIGLFIPVAPFGLSFLRPVFKILLLPLSCGVGYELIKICGKHDNVLTRIIAAPGRWAQRITTKEPDEKMCEVAIKAMLAVIPDDGTDIVNK